MSYDVAHSEISHGVIATCPKPFNFWTQICLPTQASWIGRLGLQWLFDLEYPSWEQIIRRATSKLTSPNRRFGLPNPPTTLSRSLRMPFEGMNPHFGTANTPKTLTR